MKAAGRVYSRQLCEHILHQWADMNRSFPRRKSCYSDSWAEGAVMDNVLARKQGFSGTIDAGTDHRIMQWNLTGLRGATWDEELINVWGANGVICTLLAWTLCAKKAGVLFDNTTPMHRTLERRHGQNAVPSFVFAQLPLILNARFKSTPATPLWSSVPLWSMLSYDGLPVLSMTCPWNHFLHNCLLIL